MILKAQCGGWQAIPSQGTISSHQPRVKGAGKDPADPQRSESRNPQEEHPTNATKESNSNSSLQSLSHLCIPCTHTGSPIYTGWAAESMTQQKKKLFKAFCEQGRNA